MAAEGSRRLLVAAALVCGLLVAAAPRAEADVTCGQVASAVTPCLPYLRGNVPLTPICCAGVRRLNALAQTTPDRQQTCTCLNNLAGSIPGYNPSLALGLPSKCGVNVPFPISTSTDCSKVQ